jgi:hypothetical protein
MSLPGEAIGKFNGAVRQVRGRILCPFYFALDLRIKKFPVERFKNKLSGWWIL